MEKNGVISLVFISPSSVMVLKLSKFVAYLQFFADVCKKSKPIIAIYVYIYIYIYIYASESSCFALLKNGIGYSAIT